MTEIQREPSLDPRLAQGLAYFFDRIPFNKLIGMHIAHASLDRIEVEVPMKPELVGNYLYGILHGGVISSVLDVAGGCMAVVGAFQRTKDLPQEEQTKVLSKIGTIDLRVDYLRPGKGTNFKAEGRLLRTGNKVAVTRMELHNQAGDLLALGTGTYLCG